MNKQKERNEKNSASICQFPSYLAIQSHRLLQKFDFLYDFVFLCEKFKIIQLKFEILIVVKISLLNLRESTASLRTTAYFIKLTLSRWVHVVGHQRLSRWSIEVVSHSLWHSHTSWTSRTPWIASRSHERLVRHHLIVCRCARL